MYRSFKHLCLQGFQLDIAHMGFDLLQFKDAHLMGEDERSLRQIPDLEPQGCFGTTGRTSNLTNPQRVVRNSSICQSSAFALTVSASLLTLLLFSNQNKIYEDNLIVELFFNLVCMLQKFCVYV